MGRPFAQVASFGAVGRALGSGCAAGEVSLNTVGGACGGLMKMHHIRLHYQCTKTPVTKPTIELFYFTDSLFYVFSLFGETNHGVISRNLILPTRPTMADLLRASLPSPKLFTSLGCIQHANAPRRRTDQK